MIRQLQVDDTDTEPPSSGSRSRLPVYSGRAGRQRHAARHGEGQQRRRAAGCHGHRDERRHRVDAHARLRRGRRVHRAADPGRHLHGGGRVERVQEDHQDRHPRGRRPARPHRSRSRDRRDVRDGQRRGRDADDADVVLGVGDHGRESADRGAAAQRPQLRQPHAHDSRRAPRHSRRQHRRRRQPGLARLGVVLGQRPARPRQQLHARRRGQQRDLAADGRDLPQPGRARRVQDADLDLLGRVRPVARRRRQPADQVRHEHLPRQRVRVLPRRLRSTRTTSSTTARAARRRRSASTSSAAPSAGRSSRTRRSSSPATRGTARSAGQTFLSTVPTLAMRNGDFSAINRVIYDPLTGQPFPGNVIPSNRIDTVARNILTQLYPEPNTAGTDRLHRPDARQLPDQPGQGARGRPARLEVRPQPLVEQPLLRALQLPEDAPVPAGDAGARRRGRDVRRGRRQHQGAGPRVQRHPHLQQPLAERGPVRLDEHQVLHDADRLPAEPGAGRRDPGHQPERRHVGDDAVGVPEHPEPRRQRQPAAHHQPERLRRSSTT